MIIKLNCAAVLQRFKYHEDVKENLLKLINNSYSDHMQNDYYGDDINRLDWSLNLNYNREWIRYIKIKLEEHFNECAKLLNYDACKVNGMWYQQYVQNNTHTWHIHGENYTGVYYLELPSDSPKTELVDQLDISKKITIQANEGDIVIFPSFIIHRSPKIKSDLKKTIISFNLNFTKVKDSIFSQLNGL